MAATWCSTSPLEGLQTVAEPVSRYMEHSLTLMSISWPENLESQRWPREWVRGRRRKITLNDTNFCP